MSVVEKLETNQKIGDLPLQTQGYIDGTWCDAESGSVFPVVDPASGADIAKVANMGAKDAEKAVAAAKGAFPAWAALTAKERGAYLHKWNDLIIEHIDSLAAIMTAEQGKPLEEAKGEVLYGASFVSWFAEEGRRVYGDTIPTHKQDARILVLKQPIGVVGAITPWNFPNAMITRKVAPALAAGCTICLKPAEDTPLSALALAYLAEKAGFPPGILNIVTGDGDAAPEIGKVLTTHPDIRKISFTGSTEVGKILIRQSADTVKKVSMELGGNAPFIVFESADLDRAVDGLMACKIRNMGQACVSANRVYVQDSIYDAFAQKLTAKMKDLKIGRGDEEGVKVGPLINQQAVDKVSSLVEDARKKGGEILCGGKLHGAGALFYEPTVIAGVNEDMQMKDEEIFGPVAPLYRFKTEDEVIRKANDTRYGLASYFYSNDLGQCFRVGEALEYGMVAVNEPVVSGDSVPFGGVKESGIGREGSKYGIEEFTEIKYMFVGGL